LLTKDNSDIVKHLKSLESETKNLKMELLKMTWYMRGGLTWQEALNLAPDERELVASLVKDNLETTKKSGQPFF